MKMKLERLVAGSETFTSGVTATIKALLATANYYVSYTGVTKRTVLFQLLYKAF